MSASARQTSTFQTPSQQFSTRSSDLSLHPQFPVVVIVELMDFVRLDFVPLRPFKNQPNVIGVAGGYSFHRKARQGWIFGNISLNLKDLQQCHAPSFRSKNAALKKTPDRRENRTGTRSRGEDTKVLKLSGS